MEPDEPTITIRLSYYHDLLRDSLWRDAVMQCTDFSKHPDYMHILHTYYDLCQNEGLDE